jgi:hypothetical protein
MNLFKVILFLHLQFTERCAPASPIASLARMSICQERPAISRLVPRSVGPFTTLRISIPRTIAWCESLERLALPVSAYPYSSSHPILRLGRRTIGCPPAHIFWNETFIIASTSEVLTVTTCSPAAGQG